jgi:predicted nucleic acid-binding protein
MLVYRRKQLRVVSNTTPILSLIKIGKLDLLPALYRQVTVPEAVYREIMAGYDKEYFADIRNFGWITVESIGSVVLRQALYDLDDGEAETIVIAQEQSADLVIIDEKNGRRAAERLGLTLTGTIGVLLTAKKCGFITEIAPLLSELQNCQSWMSKGLIKTAIEIAGE